MDYFAWDLLCGAVGLVFFITVLSLSTRISRATSSGGTSSSQPPPRVNGIALIPALVKDGFPAVANHLYVKYGSVFTVSSFGLNLTVLIGPEVTAHFFQGFESEISHGNMLEFTVPMFGKAVGYGRDRATRIEQTRFHVESLKASRLSSHVSPMLQEVEAFFSNWGKEGMVDLKVEFGQLLMLISARCLLGKEVRENMFHEVCALFGEVGKGAGMMSFLFPYLPIPANRQRDRAHLRLTEILSDVVESRKSCGRAEEEEDDALQRLIESKYKDGRSTTVAEVVGSIIALVFAGKHSSSHTSTWTGACLLSHPTFLRAAVEEQKQITARYKDGLDYNAFTEMGTLHNCIKEVLRMHPPAPVLVRKAHKSFTVETKEGIQYGIPQDHIVATPVIVTNNIPSIYKHPQVYDPDRFGPDRKEDRLGGKFCFTSFSAGRHACTGEAYAYLQIKVIWSHLIRNFELELISPFPATDWTKFVAEPKGNLFIRYKRRAAT